jgi:hypothetical protein
MNILILILWIAGLVTMWIPDVGPLITMLLWSFPAAAAVGTAFGELK